MYEVYLSFAPGLGNEQMHSLLYKYILYTLLEILTLA